MLISLLVSLLVAQTPARNFSTADVNLYVDPDGSDSNPCTASGSSACLTIQGAVNKSPKDLRHRLTVNVAAGTFAGFYLSDFTHDVGTQQATGGIVINGTLSNSVLASGTATGTATAGTAGAHASYGTLTDATQAWTTDDLRGRFVVLTGGTGSGQIRPISTNSATVITIVYTFSPSPDVTTTYAIRDATSVIGTPVAQPATATVNSIANSTGIYIAGNNSDFGSNSTSISISNFRISAVASNGITVRPGVALALSQIQFASGSATTNRLNALAGGSSVSITNITSLTSSTTLTHLNFGSSLNGGSSVSASLLQNGARGVVASGTIGGTSGLGCIGVETLNTQNAPFSSQGGSFFTDGTRANCATVSGNAGYVFGYSTASLSGLATAGGEYPPSFGILDRSYTAGCDSAVRVSGRASVNISAAGSLTGTAVSNVFDVRKGGTLSFTSTGVTGATNEVSLDNIVTSTASAIDVGNCISTMGFQSAVCRR